MLNNNSQKLLEYLLKSEDCILASDIANTLNVTTRTIRNCINEINSLSNDEQLVSSSRKGIIINKDLYYSKFDDRNKTNNRINLIFKELILNNSFDIYDLSESLFISESTLEKDLMKIRKTLDKFHLKLKKSNNSYLLLGSEKDKRSLMSYLLYNESKNHFFIYDKFKTFYKEYNFLDLKKEVKNILSKYELFTNEYTLDNLLLHLLITIDRISASHIIIEDKNLTSLDEKKEIKVAREIAFIIKEHFNVTLVDSEILNLSLLLMAKTSLLDRNSITIDNLSNYIDKDIIDFTSDVLKKVQKYYDVNFNNNEFFVKFVLHIDSLIKRANYGYLAKNPLIEQFKSSYPLIYEFGVYVSLQLKKEMNITLNDDEIGFIAFHLGTLLESTSNNKEKLKYILICPSYNEIAVSITSEINAYFGDQLTLKDVVYDETATLDDVNLIISLVDKDLLIKKYNTNKPIINISPFFNFNDKTRLNHYINEGYSNKKKSDLKNKLNYFYKNSLFKRNFYKKDEFEMIEALCKNVILEGYADSSFIYDVLDREKMSSTSFPNFIAIPHAMNMNTKKSAISIVINDKPMKWGAHDVNIIILLAIKKSDKNIFSDILDDLIEILSNESNFKRLLSINSFEDFIDILTSSNPS